MQYFYIIKNIKELHTIKVRRWAIICCTHERAGYLKNLETISIIKLE